MRQADDVKAGREATRLPDALPFLRRLPTGVRLQVSERLRVPADSLLNLEVSELADRIPLVATELARVAWEYVLDDRVGEMVPGVRLLDGVHVNSSDTSTRLHNLLHRKSVSDWAEIAELTPRAVWEWKNAGATTVVQLVALSIEKGLEVVCNGRPAEARGHPSSSATDDDEWARWTIVDSLAEIVAWAVAEHGANNVTEAIELLSIADVIPADVQEARQRLDRANLSSFATPDRTGKYDLSLAIKRVEEALEPRQLELLYARPFSLDRSRTLEELGTSMGVTRERVRQLEAKALAAIEQALSRSENQVIKRTAGRLATSMGAAIPVASCPLNLEPADPGTPVPLDTALLLWLAGKYRYWNGWLVRGGRPAELIERSRESLTELILSHPVIEQDRALEVLESLGIHREHYVAWIDALDGFEWRGEYLVRSAAPLAERAMAILHLRGEPLTREAIAEELDCNVRSLGNLLIADDRFRRLSLTHFGLSAWGGEEYSNIVDEITQEIERSGGEAPLEHLVETLTTNFGVSPNSVRSYAAGRWFIRTGGGAIKVNPDPTGQLSGRSIEFTKRAFRVDGVWAYRVSVTSETLRGSGSPLPAGVAAYLGVVPGDACDLQSPFATVRVSWPSLQPALGTVRAAAEELQAVAGDYLFVRFVSRSEADFRLVRRSDFDGVSDFHRLALEVGDVEAGRSADRDWIQARVADALGLDKDSGAPAIRQRLLTRGEDDLANLLTSEGATVAGDALDRLTDVLSRASGRQVSGTEVR